jgi:hypothetical protein
MLIGLIMDGIVATTGGLFLRFGCQIMTSSNRSQQTEPGPTNNTGTSQNYPAQESFTKRSTFERGANNGTPLSFTCSGAVGATATTAASTTPHATLLLLRVEHVCGVQLCHATLTLPPGLKNGRTGRHGTSCNPIVGMDLQHDVHHVIYRSLPHFAMWHLLVMGQGNFHLLGLVRRRSSSSSSSNAVATLFQVHPLDAKECCLVVGNVAFYENAGSQNADDNVYVSTIG